jgi:hypothetical protein
MRAASSKVLGVLDNWEEIDVTGLDIEDVIRKFKNVRARDFNPTSLDAYARRFRNAVLSFLEYVKDPAAWKATSRIPRNGRNANGQVRDTRHKADAVTQAELKKAAPETPPGRGLIEYPFPIRDTQVARLMLPRDLTVSEVKRIHGFMLALAVDKAEDV